MWVDNNIGVEGSRTISEFLKKDSVLVGMNLLGDIRCSNCNKNKSIWNILREGNWIGEEGERMLMEVVETKTSLELLFPACD